VVYGACVFWQEKLTEEIKHPSKISCDSYIKVYIKTALKVFKTMNILRSITDTTLRYKRGFIRNDGLIFWAYDGKGDEIWKDFPTFEKDYLKTKDYALKYAHDDGSIFKSRVRSLVNRSFLNARLPRPKRVEDILCTSYEDFREHIESLLPEGAQIDNLKSWSLRHYVPYYLAETVEDMTAVNHYANIVPAPPGHVPLWKMRDIPKDPPPDEAPSRVHLLWLHNVVL
jgi:hypothetical protein